MGAFSAQAMIVSADELSPRKSAYFSIILAAVALVRADLVGDGLERVALFDPCRADGFAERRPAVLLEQLPTETASILDHGFLLVTGRTARNRLRRIPQSYP
jgi:hypothetical protein